MAPPKKPGVARHVQITPYVRVKAQKLREGDGGDGWWQTHNGDVRVDRALAWMRSQPSGTVQAAVWDLFIAAVNGELGVAASLNLSGSDDAEAHAALAALLDNMVLDEE